MRLLFLVNLFFVFGFSLLNAQETFQNRKGLAINGYDTVAYFTQGRPVKGDSRFSHYYNGATWQFVSTENKTLFIQKPESYMPQYGGYCAYAVSQGYTARIKPDAWQIVEGKLYLNYNKRIRRKWGEMSLEYIKLANRNWPEIRIRKINKK